MENLDLKNFETLQFELQDRVAIIRLNRPETMNAINQKMRQELSFLLDEIESNDHLKVVVLGSIGRGFSSGGDLVEGLAGYDTVEDKILSEYIPIFNRIQQSGKIYISSIYGACTGIASGVALAADLSLMSTDAYLYVPFAGLNLVPDGGVSYQLVRHLGYKKAMEVFTGAEKLSALDCEKYGLVNRVVSKEELDSATLTWAKTLSEGAPLSHQLGKQCLQFALQHNLEETVAFEAKHQVTCSKSPDTLAAIKAMFNKEKPTFV